MSRGLLFERETTPVGDWKLLCLDAEHILSTTLHMQNRKRIADILLETRRIYNALRPGSRLQDFVRQKYPPFTGLEEWKNDEAQEQFYDRVCKLPDSTYSSLGGFTPWSGSEGSSGE